MANVFKMGANHGPPRHPDKRQPGIAMSEEFRRLRFASFFEATTLAVLVAVAVPLKHVAGWDAGVRILGPLHGFAFLLYVWSVAQAVSAGPWSTRETARLLIAAVIPFAGFTTIGLIHRKAASEV